MPWLDDPETFGGWFTLCLMCLCGVWLFVAVLS